MEPIDRESKMPRKEMKMSKRLVPLMMCSVFLAVAGAREPPGSLLQSLRKHTWQVGPEISYYQYKEPGLMEEEGTLYGIVGSYTYRGWAALSAEELAMDPAGRRRGQMFKLDGRFSWGEVDYDGELTDGTPYTIDDIDDYVLDFRLLWGSDSLGAETLNTFYIGLGYRYLNDDPSFDPYGYERESNYFYVPIGIDTISDLGNRSCFGLTGEVDLLLFGIQVSHFSDLDPAYDDIENLQWFGFGLRGSARYEKKTQALDFVIEPFIRYWWVEQSDPEYFNGLVAYEPKNRSLEYGIHLIFRF